MQFLRRIQQECWQEWPWLLAVYGAMVVLALSTALLAFVAGPMLQTVLTGEPQAWLLQQNGQVRWLWNFLPTYGVQWFQHHLQGPWAPWLMPGLLVFIGTFKALAQWGQFYWLGTASQRIVARLRQRLFARLLHYPPSLFHHRPLGDVLSRLQHDCQAIEQALFYGVGPLLRDSLSVLLLLLFCLLGHPRLFAWTLLVVPLMLWPLWRFGRWLRQVASKSHQEQGEMQAICHEALSGLMVVQAFGAESFEQQRLAVASQRYVQWMGQSYFIRALRTPLMEWFGTLGLAVLLGILAYRIRVVGEEPAQYISFLTALLLMYEPLKKLGHLGDFLALGHSAMDRIWELLHYPTTLPQLPHPKPFHRLNQAMVLQHVHLGYGKTTVLRDLNLTIGQGQMVALVGASGAGKTTLLHALLRMLDVQAGAILFDGIDIRHMALQDVRRQFAWVGQEPFLFHGTVLDNVRYGQGSATLADVQAACQAAHADEFITRLPKGYQTTLGERGVLLSGGQRQRLAIARALLKDAPVLLLDEATSHLDGESEQAVQLGLQHYRQHRTIVAIAHRLSTIQQADHIVVFAQGRVVEQGQHGTLMAQGGMYARYWRTLHEQQAPVRKSSQASSPQSPSLAQGLGGLVAPSDDMLAEVVQQDVKASPLGEPYQPIGAG